MQAGGLANAYGTGVTYPFLVIYLHNVRGFPLGVAGLVVATSGAIGLLAGLAAGSTVDRVGGRLTLAGSLVLLSLGYGGFPLIREFWHAFLLAALAGIGNGAFWPSQSTLLAELTPPARRHAAYALQRVSRNLGLGLGGLTGGLIATTSEPTSFTVLFLIDAATFLVFAGVLSLVPEPHPGRRLGSAEPRGRYFDVLRDRPFVGLVIVNVAFVSAGYAQLELLPVFAKNEAGVTERGIGLIFLLNTLALVITQLPVAKLLEGRRRMRALALMTVLWATAWLIVLAGGLSSDAFAALALLALAAVVFGLGTCFHGPTQGALAADLALPRLRGRYMALMTISWQLGFVVGPAVGGFILATSPLALWPLAALVCLAAGAGALALERGIPRELRLTPG